MRDDLRLIQKESTRACNIIKTLARFTRQQPVAVAPLRMTEVVMSVVELRQHRLTTEGIELRVVDEAVQLRFQELDVGRVQSGETFLVSAAAGSEYRIAIDGDRGARGTAVLNWKPVGNLPACLSLNVSFSQ